MGLTVCKADNLNEIEYINGRLNFTPIKYLDNGGKTSIKILVMGYYYTFSDYLLRDEKFAPSKIINIDLTDNIWKKYNKWIGIDPRIYFNDSNRHLSRRIVFNSKLQTLCEIHNQVNDFNMRQICNEYHLNFAKPIVAKIRKNPISPILYGKLSAYIQPGDDIILTPFINKKIKLNQHTIIDAFSHFSYHNSDGKYLICPVKGKIDGNEVYLSEPNVHKPHYNYRPGEYIEYNSKNHGNIGIALFFSKHVCTKICEKFIKPNISDEFKERFKKWINEKCRGSMTFLAKKLSEQICTGNEFCSAEMFEWYVRPRSPPSQYYYSSASYNDNSSLPTREEIDRNLELTQRSEEHNRYQEQQRADELYRETHDMNAVYRLQTTHQYVYNHSS